MYFICFPFLRAGVEVCFKKYKFESTMDLNCRFRISFPAITSYICGEVMKTLTPCITHFLFYMNFLSFILYQHNITLIFNVSSFVGSILEIEIIFLFYFSSFVVIIINFLSILLTLAENSLTLATKPK